MPDTEQQGFSAAEKAAMKERAAELKAPKKRMTKAEKQQAARAELEAKIDSFEGNDQLLARRLHQLIVTTAPQLEPKLWYGMPAYALDGKVLCFIQDAKKFEARYLTFGFNDVARLDEGTLWPTSFAITALDEKQLTMLTELVAKAVSQ